jgi:Carboxypeptidase regulatory-like domain
MRLLPVLVFVCCGAAFGQAHSAPGCSADGTVVNAVTGAPVPHARVTLRASASVGAITEADGKWALAGMACGPVQFTAFLPGFVTGIYGGRGLLSDPGSEEAVFLDPGSPAHDLRFQLLPESSIEGSVLDEFGSGLNAARVVAFRSEVNEGRRVLQDAIWVQTDSLGRYRIGGLRPGRYLACSGAEQPTYPAGGGKPLEYSNRCYPGTSASSAASTITLGAGAALRVDFNLTPIRTIDVRGDIRGLPSGVLHPSLHLSRSPDDKAEAPIAASTQGSTFRFSGVAPGGYRLLSAVNAGGQQFFASMAIDAGDSDLDGVVVQFVPGASVTGAVQLEASPNSTAAPPVFTAISVALVPQDRINSGPLPAAWDVSHGSFTFSGVEPGTYSLKVAPPAPWYVKSIRLNNEELRGKEFDISGAAGAIEITLSNAGGRIEGSLADRDGKPVDGTIFLFGPEPALPAIAETTNGGQFTFRDLAPGEYRVCAFDEGYKVEYADPEWLQKNGGPGEAVTIVPATVTQVSLTRRTVPQ